MKLHYLSIGSSLFLCLCLSSGAVSAQGQTRFERMDRNNNGQLSRQEFRGKASAFTRLDRNNDGYISLQEAENTARVSTDLMYVDTHNHIVGQVSGGANRTFDYANPARTALEAMDAAGVRVNLVMPMPQTVEQKNRLYLDDILPVVEQYSGRFAVLGGGGSLNVMIQEAITAGHVSDTARKKFDDTAAALIAKGIVGFGEMTAEHFSMKSDHPYVSAPPDHPLFLRLADLAAKYNVPVDLHMEAIPEEMELPSRLKSPPNPQVLKPNIAALERLLAHNRKARIIWVHLGWDNTGKRTVALMRELLTKHLNLYLSIRVASGMQARGVVAATFPLDGSGNLKQDWLELFSQFPERFVIGSDEIILQDNRHPSTGSIQTTVGLLKQLPEALQRKIGYENAYLLFGLKK